MFKSTFVDTKKLTWMALAALMILFPAGALYAETLDYTISGVGSGTIVAGPIDPAFSDVAFSISYIEDPATVVPLSPGYYILENINGTFTEGSYTNTFTDDYLEVNENQNTGSGAYETVVLFNADYGSALVIGEDPILLGYALATPITTGVRTSNIAAYQDTLGFTTVNGDVVEFTSVSSLDFTVTGSTPEPSSFLCSSRTRRGGATDVPPGHSLAAHTLPSLGRP